MCLQKLKSCRIQFGKDSQPQSFFYLFLNLPILMILFVQALFKFCSSTNYFQILRGPFAEEFLLLALQFTDVYDRSKFAVSILTV